ncbi:MAG: divalent-cation tolerance protein CutA [Desulfobacterales bacterium]
MAAHFWIYMTAGDMDEARAIGRMLVKDRLAACVNLLDKMQSLYWWDGEVQESTEVVMIAKTVDVKVPELMEKVKAMHSYECPCILTVPVTGGNPDFLSWIDEQTA